VSAPARAGHIAPYRPSPAKVPAFRSAVVFMLWRRVGELLMYRRSLIIGLIASSYFAVRRANAWSLVTRQQLQRENVAPHEAAAPVTNRSGAPTIRILEPDTTKPIRSPVRIRVSFQAGANARILVNTLRVRYGFLGIDITRRILAHATPTSSGVSVENAELPRGHHRVTVQIADNLNRVGVQSFEFNVV
jgi:hypothetical protein